MQTYEIEIKCLLGSHERAAALRMRMALVDPDHALVGQSKQLNHYFVPGPMDALYERVGSLFDDEERKRLQRIVAEGKSFSVRTRETDDQVLFVVKAAIDDSTSDNGIARIEFESPVPLTLAQLDDLLIDAGSAYQAKWSREREEYRVRGIAVTIDRNAGYGYVAELEKVIDDPAHAERVKQEIRELMALLEVEELPQDRLERMFAHYNAHWPEYYGTDIIFTIE